MSPPRLIRFPDVCVLVQGGVVRETARTSRDGFLDRIDWDGCTAGNCLDLWIACGKDVEALIASQTELHRHGIFPAFTLLDVGRLSTGEKNPVQL